MEEECIRPAAGYQCNGWAVSYTTELGKPGKKLEISRGTKALGIVLQDNHIGAEWGAGS